MTNQPLSSFDGLYWTKTQNFNRLFSPVVIQENGSITIADSPVIVEQYNPATLTLTFKVDGTFKNEGESFPEVTGEIEFVPDGNDGYNFSGTITPDTNQSALPYTGTPVYQTPPFWMVWKGVSGTISDDEATYGIGLVKFRRSALHSRNQIRGQHL